MSPDLISKEDLRCGNEECQKRTICKRFLQYQIENPTKKEGVWIPRFEEKDCPEFLEFDDHN